MADSPLWADIDRAADLFSIPASTFREYVARGLLPEGVKIAGKRLWKVSDVDAALEALKPGAKNDPVLMAIERLGNGEAKKGRGHAA